jgi:molybdopterin-guanine dinucleotide biosynthesis protein A
MTTGRVAPIGVVLAGGAGRRIGGSKATVALRGRPLISYPVAALREAFADVAVVAKADTELPPLPDVAIWIDRDEPRHPLAGIVRALELAEGRPVLVCAGDLAFVTPALAREVAGTDPQGAPAVVPRAGGRLQPLFALYLPSARGPLVAAARTRPLGPLVGAVEALGPRVLELPDERVFFNVNAPEDLLTATALMDRGEPPSS